MFRRCRRFFLFLFLSWLFASTGASAARADEPQGSVSTYKTTVRVAGGSPQPLSHSLEAADARRLAGSGGDPATVAQDLPGIARPAPGATGLVVWGAAPSESRVIFDGIEIPALYHFGGFRSTVGSELVGRVEVVPGAFSAEYGRALGGLVRLDSRSLDVAGTRVVLDANLLDAGLSVRSAPRPGLRLAFALRGSYLGETYGRWAPANATALFPVPRYADAQAEAGLDVGARGNLRALLLASSDRMQRTLAVPLRGLATPSENARQRWWRAGLSYTERGEDDGLSALLFVGGDDSGMDQESARTPTLPTLPTLRSRTSTSVGARSRYRATVAAGMRLTLGTDSVLARTRVHQSGSLTIPSREGDLTYFGQPPGHHVNADTWTATTGDLGVFASVSWTKGAWTLVPGLRADAFPVDGDRLVPPVGSTPRIGYSQLAWALDPRLSLAWGPLPDFIVRGAAGLYHQPVDPDDLSAIFGSPTLGPSRALHGAVALWKKLSETSSVELTGFYRRLDELTVRSPQPTPPLGEALSSDGRGRVVGASAELRRSLSSGTQGWLTYTLARSSRATSDGRLRLFDFDQTHVLTGVAAHQRGPWSFGARIRYATGMPRTPVVGAFFDAREGISQPFFGAPNSRRLPAFFQCDARIDRQVVAGSVTLIVYVDIQNVLARRNPEEVVYSQDLKTSGYLTGAPLLVLVGLRLES